jgi:hypothetical protein
MRGALHLIEWSKQQIEVYENKITEEKSKKKNDINWDYIKHLQFLIENEKSDRFKGEKQKHEFLNHENETTRRAATEMFLRYSKVNEKQKRRGDWK